MTINEALNLIRKARKEFYSGELISEYVKDNFEIFPNETIQYLTKPQRIDTIYGTTTLLHGTNNLDSDSKKRLKRINTANADLLLVKKDSLLFENYIIRHFVKPNNYLHNPIRLVAVRINYI